MLITTRNAFHCELRERNKDEEGFSFTDFSGEGTKAAAFGKKPVSRGEVEEQVDPLWGKRIIPNLTCAESIP